MGKLEEGEVQGYELQDGLVLKKTQGSSPLLCVPGEMQENVIRMIHEKIGHLGVEKCYEQIRKACWFEHMKERINRFIQNCIKCSIYSAPARSNEHNMFSIPKRPIPFYTIHLGHFGPLPALRSKRKHILVMIDAFTKFVKLYPVNSTSSKEVCCSLEKYFSYYSRPRRGISDRGTCFTSYEFSDFLLKNNVSHVKVATASPQANGQVEKVNRVLKAMLSKQTEPIQHSDWTKKLSQVEYALNSTVHCTTRCTPSELLFGANQRGCVVDEMTEYLEDKFLDGTYRDINETRENALGQIEKSQKYNSEYFLKHSVPAKTYSAGDFVVIRHVDTSVGTNKKFVQKYRGPYVVHKVLPNDRYVIRDIDNCQLTQLPYDGIVEALKIRRWLLTVAHPESNSVTEASKPPLPRAVDSET
ncbi:uncharacterized protein K02A2.6-like [Rhagoletis pomonella]|uniref:uncharacterized protein K02A2.6-like n=1 Tax=Rhagoletis pomonella TaxID=28610 RepID=UPI001784866A|nr:uncharacterized protein K02A2.6-like [Rhagoletis pomonella]